MAVSPCQSPHCWPDLDKLLELEHKYSLSLHSRLNFTIHKWELKLSSLMAFPIFPNKLSERERESRIIRRASPILNIFEGHLLFPTFTRDQTVLEWWDSNYESQWLQILSGWWLGNMKMWNITRILTEKMTKKFGGELIILGLVSSKQLLAVTRPPVLIPGSHPRW